MPTINEAAVAIAILSSDQFNHPAKITLCLQALNNLPVDRVTWPAAGVIEDANTS